MGDLAFEYFGIAKRPCEAQGIAAALAAVTVHPRRLTRK